MTQKKMTKVARTVSLLLCYFVSLACYSQAIEGTSYYLPKTAMKFTLTVEKTQYEPGQFAGYAQRYMKQDDVQLEVAGKFHKRDLTGDGNLTHEVGSEDERAIEHGQEQRVLVGQVIVDTLCNGFHVLQDFALGNRRLERLIKNLYGSHGFRY